MSVSTCFQKAWSNLLGREVEDDAMPSWGSTMDALRGDIEITEGGNYYGTTTELRTGDVVEESPRYDTWERAEAWVRERLNTYNNNRGSIVNGGVQEHPFSGKRYQDYWINTDKNYIGTVWERD
jgi:hypothetical protein